MTQTLTRMLDLDRTPAEVFAWHTRQGALARLTPPWESVELVAASGGIKNGGRVEMLTAAGPLKLRWIAEHYGYEEGGQFCDRALAGPFARWEHVHRFEPRRDGGCRLVDEVTFALPFAPFSKVANHSVLRRINRIFDYRHAVTRTDLDSAGESRGRVLISGASGLIGTELTAYLQTQGWQVDRLVRREPRSAGEIQWAPSDGTVTWPDAYRCDAVVHLAGANIAGGRWTRARKQAILRSRVEGTSTLVRALGELAEAPRVFACGSATGYYGDTGDRVHDETSPSGQGFLAEVCAAWEEAARPVEAAGTRLVMLRTGVVLSPGGGALAKMLPAFKAGLGGPIGDGQQWMGWIGLPDWLRACQHILLTEPLSGPVNLTAPEPARQKVFARILGDVINRPTVMPLPAFVLRMILGQLADEALLAGSRVVPTRLSNSGFVFLHPSLENSLRHVLGRGVAT